MTPSSAGRALPQPVRELLDDFAEALCLDIRLWAVEGDGRFLVHPDGSSDSSASPPDFVHAITDGEGGQLELEMRGCEGDPASVGGLLARSVERAFAFSREIRFFTYELAERYEEINLLYSISETLGSILSLEDAARVMLEEVCDVMGARRGSLWTHESGNGLLRLTASVGEDGTEGPIPVDDPDAVTAWVFREGRARIVTREGDAQEALAAIPPAMADASSFLSVPIRYTPPTDEARTVGVLNLIGRRRGGRFTASDQKLLSAIASQVGAALENNRLLRESLARERVARELELAHDLQMKLLPAAEKFDGATVAARVEPAESVGGDFFHLLKLGGGKVGVMIGDVSSHGFPAALIMALSISAATIYAAEFTSPGQVLRAIDDALHDELETTEMYLTLFYGVLDTEKGELVYANAGHPHAFVIREDGGAARLDATEPPVGFSGAATYGERTVPWTSPADLLLLFTDGLSDKLALGDRRSGEELVLREVVERRHESPRSIVRALFELRSNVDPAPPSDDRTAVVLRS